MVLGCFYQLLQEASWDTSDANVLQLAQDRANTLIYLFQRGVPCVPSTINQPEVSFDMADICEALRFNPATGLFEGFCCGAWTPIPGQPSQGLFGGQPGIDAPLPAAGGGCQSYQLSLPGSEQRIVPPVVNTGDTIQLSLLSGLWNDGTTVWYTAKGQHFFAGIVGGTGTDGADPLPASPHMAVLCKIAGVFYDVSDGSVLTVPGGVSNALVIFQANDSSLSDNSGNIAFSVNVCNNAAATWIRDYQFELSQFGWAAYVDGSQTPHTVGVWSAGIGWSGSASNGGGNFQHGVKLDRVFSAPITVTDATMTYSLTKGSPIDSGYTNDLQLLLTGGVVIDGSEAADAATDGPAKSLSIPHGSYVMDEIYMQLYDAVHNGAIAAGQSAILELRLIGTGTPPA
jgi:hypothetical protein